MGNCKSACSGGESVEFAATEEKPILLTPTALSALKNAIAKEGKEGDGLRIAVVGGGCSGFRYSLDFEQAARQDDVVMDVESVKIYVDSVSAGYLMGTVIDFVTTEQGAGFKFNNPNSCSSCGCGHTCG